MAGSVYCWESTVFKSNSDVPLAELLTSAKIISLPHLIRKEWRGFDLNKQVFKVRSFVQFCGQ